MEIREYLEVMSCQIRNQKARFRAVQEAENHIKDQAEVYEEQGMERKEALAKAVLQMGDPVTAGVELDRIHRPQMEWRLFVWIILFSLFGLVVQYLCFYRLGTGGNQLQGISVNSAGTWFRWMLPDGMEQWRYLIQQCGYTAMGLVLMAGVCLWDYSMIGTYGGILGACFLGGITIICKLRILQQINGGYPYLRCVLYLFVPLYGGILYQNRGKGYRGLGICILWIMALFLVGAWSIGSGLGVVINAVFVCFFMFFIAVQKEWFQVSRKTGNRILAVWLAICGAWIVRRGLAPYQLARLETWLHPEKYAREAGYQLYNIRKIVSCLEMNQSCYGTLEKQGLLSFWQNLAGINSDYMILQTAITQGMVKTILLCLLFVAFLAYLFRMAAKEKNQLGQMTAFGCTMLLTIETVRTILCNFGMGVTSTGGIPFFSYGRSHTLAIYILLGVLLSIYRYRNLVWEEVITKKADEGVTAKIGRYVIRIEKERNITSV